MTNHPIIQHIYAVTKGTYIGEMLAYIEQSEGSYKFISIPKNINRDIPIDQFILGLRSKIVENVEKLPENVYNVLRAQFYYNEKSNHRRKQSNSQSLLDSD